MAQVYVNNGGRANSSNGIPTQVLREAFEKSGLSKRELCRRLGWLQHPGKKGEEQGDHRRLRRVLGYVETVSMKRLCSGEIVEYRYKQKHVSRPVAVKLVDAMGIDPVDVGL